MSAQPARNRRVVASLLNAHLLLFNPSLGVESRVYRPIQTQMNQLTKDNVLDSERDMDESVAHANSRC